MGAVCIPLSMINDPRTYRVEKNHVVVYVIEDVVTPTQRGQPPGHTLTVPNRSDGLSPTDPKTGTPNGLISAHQATALDSGLSSPYTSLSDGARHVPRVIHEAAVSSEPPRSQPTARTPSPMTQTMSG